ncbi:MAG: 6-bladed beta-propeller [Bacteroidales bacterium]|jgi:hypothetical protein|nr:6-bladed beta-propeller [Bacteroidales bacterium]
MKKKNLILLTSFFLMGSQVISPQSKTGDLPVIDISKKYLEKKIRLQDIADIEYIPLETADDILLSDRAVLSCVSDKYILLHEPVRGDIFVFNRTGKIYSHFNHRGQGGREYAWISTGTVFDEKNEEIFVCSQSIQVYSLSGEYKRTLNNMIRNDMKVFNFDDEALLVYDDVVIEPGLEGKTKKNPYSLISKKDGSIISVLDIHLPERYSARIAKIEDNNKWWPIRIFFRGYSMYYGRDFMIADMSSDTLYLLTQNRELTPILTRKPSVHASEPRIVWVPFLTTDKFILIGLIPLRFNERGGRIPVLMYEFETGETGKASILDADFGMCSWSPGNSPAIAKNMTAEMIQSPSIIEAHKKNQLKGDIEKFVMTLDEDDNPVVRIIKFK